MATPASVPNASVPNQHFAVRVEQDGEGLAVRVVGEVDIATAPALESALLGAIESEPESILLDLEQVSFIDSMGLRVLVWASRQCREDEKLERLRIDSVPGPVRRMLELCGLGPSVAMVA